MEARVLPCIVNFFSYLALLFLCCKCYTLVVDSSSVKNKKVQQGSNCLLVRNWKAKWREKISAVNFWTKWISEFKSQEREVIQKGDGVKRFQLSGNLCRKLNVPWRHRNIDRDQPTNKNFYYKLGANDTWEIRVATFQGTYVCLERRKMRILIEIK